MTEQVLQGNVALVTGGAKRIGRDIALTLARAGAAVVVNYNTSKAEAQKTVAGIQKQGGRAIAVQADVSSPAAVSELVAAVDEQLGAVDILVNNAGIFGPGEWDKVTEADWDLFMNVNLKSQFLCAQGVAAGWRCGRGSFRTACQRRVSST
jgi:3-oxoacyl-[acyl-carrier protein] reductase